MKWNNLPVAHQLLNLLDKRDTYHYSAEGLIHIAVSKGNLDMARCLLESNHVDPGLLSRVLYQVEAPFITKPPSLLRAG